MPIHCYRTEDGEQIEREFSRGGATATLTLDDGRVAFRDYQTELSGTMGFVKGSDSPCRPNRPKRPWPMAPCVASGVNAEQAGELRKHLADRGCPTEVTSQGDPIYTSAAHQKKALKIRGFTDRN